MRFYTGTQFPEDYRGNIFIAEHGSWNRSSKVGYRVVRVDGRRPGPRAVGPSRSPTAGCRASVRGLGPARPTCWSLPDGSLLVTDDQAGAIYRIRYAS